jgi:hypothetical protein
LNEQIGIAKNLPLPFSPSLPLNDEDCFVVDLIPFSNLQSMFVTFLACSNSALQMSLADFE